MNIEKMNAFLSLMQSAYVDAKQARKYSFDDHSLKREENPNAAVSYANSCTAKYCAASAIYWCSLDDLEHYEIPNLLRQFDVFTSEVRNDYATDHSRQWVDIEFERLKELFESSVCNQPITE